MQLLKWPNNIDPTTRFPWLLCPTEFPKSYLGIPYFNYLKNNKWQRYSWVRQRKPKLAEQASTASSRAPLVPTWECVRKGLDCSRESAKKTRPKWTQFTAHFQQKKETSRSFPDGMFCLRWGRGFAVVSTSKNSFLSDWWASFFFFFFFSLFDRGPLISRCFFSYPFCHFTGNNLITSKSGSIQ